MTTKDVEKTLEVTMGQCNETAHEYIECRKNHKDCTLDKFYYKVCVHNALYDQKNREIKLLESLTKSTNS
jgi:hypothetical protein